MLKKNEEEFAVHQKTLEERQQNMKKTDQEIQQLAKAWITEGKITELPDFLTQRTSPMFKKKSPSHLHEKTPSSAESDNSSSSPPSPAPETTEPNNTKS